MNHSLRYICHTVGVLEVPDEISLIYTISGCPLRCSGCHSADLRNPALGRRLTAEDLKSMVERYMNLATCVCFLGGEWHPEPLVDLLKVVREVGLKTCLYTGRDVVDDRIAQQLDFLKLGPFVPELGGLDSPTTNQRFLDLHSGENLTKRFQVMGSDSLKMAV